MPLNTRKVMIWRRFFGCALHRQKFGLTEERIIQGIKLIKYLLM